MTLPGELWCAENMACMAIGSGDSELFLICYGESGQTLKTLDDARELARAIVQSYNRANKT